MPVGEPTKNINPVATPGQGNSTLIWDKYEKN